MQHFSGKHIFKNPVGYISAIYTILKSLKICL